jgi:hypothetical protein
MILTLILAHPCYSGLITYGYKIDGVLNPNYSPVMLTTMVFVLSTCASITYAPVAASLIELFPTRIRYFRLTSGT